jgi:hypothetical protein
MADRATQPQRATAVPRCAKPAANAPEVLCASTFSGGRATENERDRVVSGRPAIPHIRNGDIQFRGDRHVTKRHTMDAWRSAGSKIRVFQEDRADRLDARHEE